MATCIPPIFDVLMQHMSFQPMAHDHTVKTLPALSTVEAVIGPIAGYIFVCHRSYVQEWLHHRIFGGTSFKIDIKHIKIGTPVFLFDSSTQNLYGGFKVVSFGQDIATYECFEGVPLQVKNCNNGMKYLWQETYGYSLTC